MREERKRQDYQDILENETVRRVLWDVLCECGVYNDIAPLSPEEVHRQLGRRSIGLALLARITDASEEALLQMSKEAKLIAKNQELEDERDEYERANTIDTTSGGYDPGTSTPGNAARVELNDFIGADSSSGPVI
jgi:hypothetical protein